MSGRDHARLAGTEFAPPLPFFCATAAFGLVELSAHGAVADLLPRAAAPRPAAGTQGATQGRMPSPGSSMVFLRKKATARVMLGELSQGAHS